MSFFTDGILVFLLQIRFLRKKKVGRKQTRLFSIGTRLAKTVPAAAYWRENGKNLINY
jgi:hypothetical protein